MQVKSYELRLGFCQRTWSTWPTSPHKPVARQPEHWAQEQPRVVQWGIPGFSIGQTTPPGWMEGNSKLLRGSECVNCGTEGLACPLWIGIIIHWSECVIRGLPQILLQLWTFQVVIFCQTALIYPFASFLWSDYFGKILQVVNVKCISLIFIHSFVLFHPEIKVKSSTTPKTIKKITKKDFFDECIKYVCTKYIEMWCIQFIVNKRYKKMGYR